MTACRSQLDFSRNSHRCRVITRWSDTVSQKAIVSRRQVLVGTASLPILGVIGPTKAASSDHTALEELGRQLKSVVRRCRRLQRHVRRLSDECEQVCTDRGIRPFLADGRRNATFDLVHRDLGYDEAWASWSMAVAKSLDLAEVIRRTPATSVADLSVKSQALIWSLFHDQMSEAIDPEHLRLLKQFGRELDRLATAKP